MAKSILVVVHIQAGQELLRGFPAVHKRVIWDGVWVQDAVSVARTENVLYMTRLKASLRSHNMRRCWSVQTRGRGGAGGPVSPLFEVSVDDAVGEALPADPDALQDAVAAQLVQDQEGVHDPCRNRVSHISPTPARFTVNTVLWLSVLIGSLVGGCIRIGPGGSDWLLPITLSTSSKGAAPQPP